MYNISQRVQSLQPSATLAMSQKSAELRAAGVDVINMSIGEPDFNTPEHIKEAAKRAIDENYTHYAPVPGYLSLRKAICENLKRNSGMEFTPEQIVVGNGAKHELANVVMSLINPGDEVLIPVPAWVSYVEIVKIACGVPVTVFTGIDNDFKIQPEALRAALTPRTRLLMLNSPSNPTGSIYSAEELEALAAVLRDFPDVVVLSDEIYEHIVFDGKKVSSIYHCEGMKDRTVIINGVSKAYAMTGWRIGYTAAPTAISKAVSKLQGQYTSGVSSIAMKAAEAAYDGPQECVETMRREFERRRDLVLELAAQIPGWKINRPEGAFYLFPDISQLLGKRFGDREIRDDNDYAMYLLEEAHVATVKGSAFSAPGYIRLSYATSEDNIREAMRRIRVATEALK